MEIVRFQREKEVNHGLVTGGQVRQIEDDVYGEFELLEKKYPLSEVDLLAPCQPQKIVCVGLNYRDHAQELNMDLPAEPVVFLKPPTAVVGPGAEIKVPAMSEQVDYEAELAVVIKNRIKDISTEEAEQHILGYTCFNDVTARDLQEKDGQWTRAKSFDTFAPLGPKIVTEVAPHKLDIELLYAGEVKQSSNTSQMIFTVFELVSFISQIMTLEPGDVIATGTPTGVGTVESGAEVEVKIEGIGSLVNRVK